MPQAIIDPEKCDPEHCPNGVCAIKGNCPVKGIYQPERGETPIVDWSRCRGCSLCIAKCPLKAVKLE
jgi:NAD-dependent dihydropyrimidine dehydrogenase PreA subunit